MSQQELAKSSGLSARAVRELEKGRVHRPRNRTLRALSKALSLSAREHQALVGTDEAVGSALIRVELLGSLTVSVNETVIDLGPAKQRIAFGVLALQPARPVSRADLIDFLWENDPPPNAAALTCTYISRLRRLLRDRELIQSTSGGYRLLVEPSQVDAERFKQLSKQAQQAADSGTPDAIELFEQALDHWQGPILAGEGDRLQRHALVTTLGLRRVEVTLHYADLAIEQGRCSKAVERLARVLATEPFHEELASRLMLVLAGAGQQQPALDLFNRIRDQLSTELGVDPGPALRNAHLQVLRQQIPVASLLPPDRRQPRYR